MLVKRRVLEPRNLGEIPFINYSYGYVAIHEKVQKLNKKVSAIAP